MNIHIIECIVKKENNFIFSSLKIIVRFTSTVGDGIIVQASLFNFY